MYHVASLVRLRSNQLSVSPWDAALKKPVQSSLISVTPGTRIFKCDYISLYLHNWAVLRLCIVFSIGESPCVCSKYLSRCNRIPFESKGALSVNFSSIAIELNVPSDEFSSIAIRPTVSVALRRGFKKKTVQSSLILVTPETRIFKCDHISLYLHNWAVLRFCIVFSIGESPRVCS